MFHWLSPEAIDMVESAAPSSSLHLVAPSCSASLPAMVNEARADPRVGWVDGGVTVLLLCPGKIAIILNGLPTHLHRLGRTRVE